MAHTQTGPQGGAALQCQGGGDHMISQLVAPRTGTPWSQWTIHTDHLPMPWTASPMEQDLVLVRDAGFLCMSSHL